jgi:NADH-quinone oxidoreductase subunit N
MNALLISAFWGVIMMFSSFLFKEKSAIRNIAIAGLVIIIVANLLEMNGKILFHIDTRGMIYFDRFSLLFNSIFFFSTFIYFLLSAKDMEKVGDNYAEYFALIFFILCGVTLVTSFKSLLILFLGIEIISIPLYILTGADKRNLKSNEASLKYFLMGSFSTGLMLMGIALIYGARGSFMTVIPASIPEEAAKTAAASSVLLVAGMILLLFSMSFKVSAAPFHFWTPDVYDGAPSVFTSFMATIVKAAVFAGFIRLFADAFGMLQSQWQLLVAIITAATLFIGNITAVFQQSVKRMLAYSSISQAGFMLFALYAMNADAKEGLILYAAGYSFATIGVFAVLIKMKDYSFEGFNGFSKRQPLLAATTTIFLLSLAGIPLTAGFLSKFYMLKAAMATGNNLWLVIFAVLMAAVSVYYYFRVIQAMYFKEGDGNGDLTVTTSFKSVLVLLAIVVILLGIFPGLLLNWYYF